MSLPLTRDSEIGSMSYNGFQFPPAKSSKVRITPVADPSERMTEYLEVEIEVVFIVTREFIINSGVGATGSGLYNAGNIKNNQQRNFAQAAEPALGTSVDSLVEHIYRTISVPQKKLVFSLNGIGEIFAVQDGVTSDVKNGPRPQVVELLPIASNRAYQITWTVVTHVPYCPKPANPDFVSGLGYEVEWNFDSAGLLTRTITGEYNIATARDPDTGKYVASADDFWPIMLHEIAKPLSSFRRTLSRKLSRDRRSMEFMITDEQIPSAIPFYPGTVNMDIKLKGNASLEGGAFGIWAMSVAGTIQVAPGYPKVLGWMAYIDAFDRVFAYHDKGLNVVGSDDVASSALVTKISFEDSLYSQDMSFAIDYTLFCSDSTLLTACGYFKTPEQDKKARGTLSRPLFPTQNDWVNWSRLMPVNMTRDAATYFGTKYEENANILKIYNQNFTTASGTHLYPGGIYSTSFKPDLQALYFNSLDETLINLCEVTSFSSENRRPPRANPSSGPTVQVQPTAEMQTATITPSNSWIAFKTNIVVARNNKTIYSQPLEDLGPDVESLRLTSSQADDKQKRNDIPDVDGDASANIPTPEDAGYAAQLAALGIPSGNQRVITRRRSKTEYTVTFTGYAMRAAYPVPEVNLVSVGGVKAIKIGTDQIARSNWSTEAQEVQKVDPVSIATGKQTAQQSPRHIKLHAAAWSKTYVLAGKPNSWDVVTDQTQESVHRVN